MPKLREICRWGRCSLIIPVFDTSRRLFIVFPLIDTCTSAQDTQAPLLSLANCLTGTLIQRNNVPNSPIISISQPKQPKRNFIPYPYLQIICCNECIFKRFDLSSCFSFSANFKRVYPIHKKITFFTRV